MHSVRRGSGPPLLLIHGLGGNHRSWDTVIDALAAEREVIAVDLPGFGQTPPLAGKQSVEALTDAVEAFVDEQDLGRVDMAGSSMGARMVLELARRGRAGRVVALDPGGFWNEREAAVFHGSVKASIKLLKALSGALPALTGNRVTRTALLGQFSARPWALDGDVVLLELQSFVASPVIEDVLRELATGPRQAGGRSEHPIVIGWGRRDLVTLPRQAARAQAAFPDARLHWFEACGHFPHWDAPADTARLILGT